VAADRGRHADPAARIASLRIDPIQLGILTAINSGIGIILPPMGTLTFLTASIAQVGTGRIFRAVIPYAAALMLVLLAMVFG
jgi:TRAP-type C4-dicarboxylate transport system permease large subunit